MANADANQSPGAVPDVSFRRRGTVGSIAESSILAVIVAAAGSFATSLITFAWGCAKVWNFGRLLIDKGADESLAIVRLLEVIDVFLLGTVLLIIAVGLVELFITPLRLPGWLVIKDLDDLKGKIIDVIILVAAIKFLEKLVTAKVALDVLYYAVAVAVVIGALIGVRLVKKSTSYPG